jgi:hypothetical protein
LIEECLLCSQVAHQMHQSRIPLVVSVSDLGRPTIAFTTRVVVEGVAVNPQRRCRS